MYEIDVSHHYDAPPAAVFDVLSDHATFLTAGPVSCRVLVPGDPSPNGVGAVREVRANALTLRETILTFDPPHRYDYRIVEARGPLGLPVPVRHERGWIEVAPQGSGSAVVWRSRFEVRLPGIAGWLERQVGRQMSQSFSRLLTRAAARTGVTPSHVSR